MPSAPATGDTTARTLEAQFLDLICSDADLLAAEFDAIIAAEWSMPPPDGRGSHAAGGHPRSATAEPVRSPVRRPQRPGTDGWARQRSPPFRPPTQNSQENSQEGR
jgi:hypothetical protein